MKHNSLGLGDIHRLTNWEYTTASARTSATGFTADDIGKIAKQTDNNTFWELTAVTPAWLQIGGWSNIQLDITINDEAANFITVDIQVQDSSGNNLSALYWFDVLLSDSDEVAIPASPAPSNFNADTGTQIFTYTADAFKRMMTDDTGYLEISIEESGAATWYLWVFMHDGTFTISDAITFAA